MWLLYQLKMCAKDHCHKRPSSKYSFICGQPTFCLRFLWFAGSECWQFSGLAIGLSLNVVLPDRRMETLEKEYYSDIIDKLLKRIFRDRYLSQEPRFVPGANAAQRHLWWNSRGGRRVPESALPGHYDSSGENGLPFSVHRKPPRSFGSPWASSGAIGGATKRVWLSSSPALIGLAALNSHLPRQLSAV